MTTSTSTFRHADLVTAKSIRTERPSFSLLTLLETLESRAYCRVMARRESEVTRFLAANGGQLTDDLERELSRRFGSIVER